MSVSTPGLTCPNVYRRIVAVIGLLVAFAAVTAEAIMLPFVVSVTAWLFSAAS